MRPVHIYGASGKLSSTADDTGASNRLSELLSVIKLEAR